jgi:hypothetical protein
METKQALQIIKEILDAASKAGLFQNLDSSIVAARALNVIESKINED